ncbi:MAG: hypothetical protein RLY12_955 [Verrucomicrobiota bacterium]|jgi:RimJ/RimL family protein N-acetyltransferase
MLPAESHLAAIKVFLSARGMDATKLRLATPEDAGFLLGLRLDPTRNRNISATSGDLADQVAWMNAYAEREVEGREAYFIVEVAGVPQGSLRLYDYLFKKNSFCWGSWIIRPGAPPATAYQSAILVYDLAFACLRFTRAHFSVRQANVSVWKFHEKMGAKMVREDELERLYEYGVEDYRQARARLLKFTQNRDFL